MGCGASQEEDREHPNDAFKVKDTKTPSQAPNVFREPSVALLHVSSEYELEDNNNNDAATNNTGNNKSNNKQQQRPAHHVRNIFAKPLDQLFDLNKYRFPRHEKSNEDKLMIETALKQNFVFEHLTAREKVPLILAFEEYSVPQGEEIIKQGDKGDNFYIIKKGKCSFEVNGKVVGEAKAGNSFGELALLYNCPRAATVTALEPTDLFRIDQNTFRYIMQIEIKKGSEEKVELLRGVEFLKNLAEPDLNKLAQVMTPHKFKTGEYLVRKGEAGDEFFIIQEGRLKAVDITAGDTKYEDLEVKPGNSVGEAALASGKPRAANVIAETDGVAFKIDKKTFTDVLGNINDLILRSLDKLKLSGIKIFMDSHLDDRTITSMATLIVDRTVAANSTLFTKGQDTEAALYLVRSGVMQITGDDGKRNVEPGGYFGTEMLLADQQSGKGGRTDPSTTAAAYTATALEETMLGVLYVRDLRTVLNTLLLNTGESVIREEEINVTMSQLQKHRLLGAGTFGQVWLVTIKDSDSKQPYALKVQSKFELVKDGQAKAVIDERNIMAKLQHPFLCHLRSSFQDDDYVYMLMSLLQGGELYAVIHKGKNGLPDAHAKFYGASIADALGHMHKRGYVYRDLKPENVLLDGQGFTVLVDFGFAKYVPDQTYTFCGTPLYLPPEIILNKGHNQAADHWSLGVLIYEMCTGETLFYKVGMEQMDLFRAIVKGNWTIPSRMNKDSADLIRGLVTKDPTQRLGSLRGGEDDILQHSWFNSIDFEKLIRKEMKAPYVPKIKDPLDVSNFDNWDHLNDKTKQKYPRLNKEDAAIFKDF